MHHVTIRSRSDGITELRPKLAPLAPSDRLLVIVTVVLVTSWFFMSGLVPAEVFAAVVLSSLVGELVLGAKALVLLALRPAAEVHEVPRVYRLRRR